VDVVEFADVVHDGHAGIGDRQGRGLRLPEDGYDVRILVAVHERRDLNIVEGQPVLAPDLSPALDQGAGLVRVEHALAVVRLALVPDGAAQGVGRQRGDHPVVEACGRTRAVERPEAVRVGRRRRWLLVLSQSALRLGDPGPQGVQIGAQSLLVLLGGGVG